MHESIGEDRRKDGKGGEYQTERKDNVRKGKVAVANNENSVLITKE